MRKNITAYLLLLPFFTITALVILSCGFVLLQSLGYVPAFDLYDMSLKHYANVFANKEFVNSLLVSLRVAFQSAVLAAIFGTVLCAALVKLKHTRGAMLYAVRLPILVPHVVVALFTFLIFSQTGIIARVLFALGLISDYTQFPLLLYTEKYEGVIISYLWKEIPFVAYFTLALMASVSETLGEAAENLGASPIRSFFSVTLPLSFPAISKAFIIIFIFAFGGYELPLLLGATLPKALPIYAYIAYMNPDLKLRPDAMAIYGVILLLSVSMAGLYSLLTGRLIRKVRGE
ncbi:MAG: ABC transporter permease subunit [Oscillospiraceae bacterium]|nr:ABC transporter permease subunit [Oscillospiraceae bacterium]